MRFAYQKPNITNNFTNQSIIALNIFISHFKTQHLLSSGSDVGSVEGSMGVAGDSGTGSGVDSVSVTG